MPSAGTTAGWPLATALPAVAATPAELGPALFEPFRRLGERAGSPDGTGLGLSVVRPVALAHRGHATVRPRPAGGLDVMVSLPGYTG